MTAPDLPKGITCEAGDFFSTCPECGAVQADMGNNVECEECDHGPMPTLDGTDWPACPTCGRPLTPKELELGMTDCGGPCGRA